MLPYNKCLKERSRTLRRNMTDAERMLWSKLRGKQLKGFQFNRQKVIGNYIADFYCRKAELVIEVDGGQHYMDSGMTRDEKRDAYISQLGLKILRFSNVEVLKNIDGVVEDIVKYL